MEITLILAYGIPLVFSVLLLFQQVGLLRSEDQHGGNGAEVGHGNYLEFVDMPRQALPPKP